MEGEWFFGYLWFGFVEQKPNLQGQVRIENKGRVQKKKKINGLIH